MSGRWSHAICERCWNLRNPDSMILDPTATDPSLPTRFPELFSVPCCFCGKPQMSGIYTREDPAKIPCGGKGPVHD